MADTCRLLLLSRLFETVLYCGSTPLSIVLEQYNVS